MQDSLRGLAMVNSGFAELVTCEDDDEGTVPIVAVRGCSLSSPRVRIVCGGGSGHEPAHAGFVCPEMLSVAVCGRIFASPSSQQVKKALAYLLADAADDDAGALVIVMNYTGDLINFKSAIVSANATFAGGPRVRVLCVGDDVTFRETGEKEGDEKRRKPPPRGLAGTVLLYNGGAFCFCGKDERKVEMKKKVPRSRKLKPDG